jgi:1,4-dihydroxy-2-naphthoate octaprenyltransferase
MRQHDAFRVARGAAGRDDDRVAGLDGPPRCQRVFPHRVDDRRGREGFEDALARRRRQSRVERRDGVAVVPHPTEGVHERRAAGEVERNETGHGCEAMPSALMHHPAGHRGQTLAVNPWVLGARPRTLPAAVVPVAVGAACALGQGEHIIWWRIIAAAVVALALQIGTNYANDYSDGVKGTDAVRVGPVRLVAGGLASAADVKRAAFLAFGIAGAVGAMLAIAVGPELFLVGAAAIAAGWFYTGGPKPYGYYGFGELFVFVFFGLVATAGTTYVLLERLTGTALAAGVAIGFLACALLVVNNLRDIPTDAAVGKRTLAVRLGDRATRWLYVALIGGAALVIVVLAVATQRWAVALGALGPLLFGVVPARAVLDGARGPALIPVLGRTARTQLATGVLLSLGLILSAG